LTRVKKKMTAIKLLFAKYVVPVAPQIVLEDHCIIVENDKIKEIVPAAVAKSKYASVPESDQWHGKEHVLMPGFVNCHTHAAMSLLRGIADDVSLMPWLQNHIWPAEGKFVSPEFVYDGTKLAIAEMIQGGITCFADMYFFPDEIAKASHETGIRAVVGLIAMGFPSAYCGAPDKSSEENVKMYIEKGIQIQHEVFKDKPLVHSVIAPHAPYSCGIAGLQHCQDAADKHGLRLSVHLHESASEVSDWKAEHGGESPVATMGRLGLLQEGLIAVHMTQLTDAEVDRVAACKVSVAHCPESNMKLASGSCPVPRLLAAGVNVALGTDGCASNNDLDMFGEMRTAALHAKLIASNPEALPAPEALHMATLAGARALGLGDATGSLEPGKAADIQAVQLGGVESTPVYSVASHLVYCTGRHQVRQTDRQIDGQTD